MRSLCAVLLRKTIMQNVSKDGKTNVPFISCLSAPVLAGLKSELVACVAGETQRHIRKKVCDAVGQLAINVMDKDLQAWPELLPFMLGATAGANVEQHEAALLIFNTLSDLIAEKMSAYNATLLEVFHRSLQAQQAMVVRIAALRSLASFLVALEDPAARHQFQDLVPFMLQTIADALSRQEEDACRDALEVFVEIAEQNTKFLKRHIEPCVSGMITIAGNTELDDSLRHLALEFLLTVAENAPTLARKMKDFCPNAVPVALGMMLEIEGDTPAEIAEWESQDDHEDDTDVANYDVGEEALDRLAIALGGKTMMPVLFEKIQAWFEAPNWKQRHAALMAISQTGEGCEAQMAKMLEQIVSTIVTKFGDVHPRVRWAAINTIGQMSTDFGPALQTKLHSSVLPALVGSMDDGCKRVQAHAAAAVINFCEHCERGTLAPYLQPLLGKLMLLLRGSTRRVQEQAVTAVASVADVAEEDFIPFYDHFMPGLKELLKLGPAKELRMLRGKAMECISLIGVAVGKERFSGDAKEVMDLLISTQSAQLDPDDPQVNFMLQACARICKCLGEHFKPYLPLVIPPLLASAQIDPELHVTDADEDGGGEEEEGMESVTVAIRGQGNKRITIRTSALEEKATACSMLHSYASDLREGFFPYVNDVTRILVPLVRFQYMDDVRTAAMVAIPVLVSSSILAVEAGVPNATAEFVTQIVHFIFEPVVTQLETEPDVDTLACMLESFSELLLHGKECVQARITAAQIQKCAAVLQLLIKESLDRRGERETRREEDDPDEEEEEQLLGEVEREECLVQNLVECIGALFKVYHSEFIPTFDALLLPLLQAMLQPGAIEADRVAALCVFDDVIEHCSVDGGSTKYVPSLFPALMQYTQDASAEVRQAAVYGVGVMAEHVAEATFTAEMQQQAAQTLLATVGHPEAQAEENASATDNAVSAIGKLCKRSETIAAAALTRWLSFLPLSSDRAEAKGVHELLCTLVEASNTHLLGANHEHLPQVICVFAQVLNSDLIDETLNPRIANLIKQVHFGLPHVLQQLPTHPAFKALTQEQQHNLEMAVRS